MCMISGNRGEEEMKNNVVYKDDATFEEALELTGKGRFNVYLLLGCGFCLITMMTETMSTSFLLPATTCDFNLSFQEKGLLTAICYVGMICSAYMWGYVADTKGRRKALMTGIILDSLCAVIASFAPSFWIFLVMRFFTGFFVCVTANVTYAYYGEFFTTSSRGKAMMILGVFIAFGGTFRSALAWIIIPQPWSMELPTHTYSSWRVFVLLCGTPGIAAILMLLFTLPESPKFLLAMGKQEDALAILRRIYSTNSGRDQETYTVKSIKMETTEEMTNNNTEKNTIFYIMKNICRQTSLLFHAPHLKNIIICCVIQFLFYGCTNSLALWIADIFNNLATFYKRNPAGPSSICEAIVTNSSNFAPRIDIEMQNITLLSILLGLTDKLQSETPQYVFTNISSAFLEEKCIVEISNSTFLNTLIYSVVTGVFFFIGGYAVKYIGKKITIYACVICAAGFATGLYFVTKSTHVLILSSFYGAIVYVSIFSLNIIIVEIFPTQMRAMAVSLTSMIGRLGTVCGSFSLGVLLDLSCNSIFFVLAGVVLVAGAFAWFLPAPTKEVD